MTSRFKFALYIFFKKLIESNRNRMAKKKTKNIACLFPGALSVVTRYDLNLLIFSKVQQIAIFRFGALQDHKDKKLSHSMDDI